MEDVRIYFVGDSYVNGTGDPEYLGWPGRLCAQSNGRGAAITCYNLGIRGDTSADVLKRWRPEVEARRLIPHDGRLVLGFGANDCWLIDGKPRVDRPQTSANARQILTQARDFLPTLMIGPPPGIDADEQARRQDVSSLLQEIAADVGVPYLDVIAALGPATDWRREARDNDQVHPGAAGYTALAQAMLQWPAWWYSAAADA